MTLMLFAGIILVSSCDTSSRQPPVIENSFVLFAGTTPCSNIIRPIHKIAAEPDCALKECKCILVEWRLTLYNDPKTQQPTVYKLTGINRYSEKGTNMYSQPGTKTESEGKWAIVKGTKTNSRAIVYQLNPDNPKISVSLLRMSNDLLHILDDEGRLLIGDEFFSYTLNKVQ
jgi:hypothetical protein